MTSLTESKAHFASRAKEIGVSRQCLRALELAGVEAMGTLAYSHGQPGQAIDEAKFSEWLNNVLGAAPSLGESASMKRLLFESQTLVLASLREQVTGVDQPHGKKIPDAEREERLAGLKASLTGILIEGPLEPSHSLLQLCVHQREVNQTYIAPERCTSRVHEVTCGKTPTKQVALESERLVVKESANIPDETATSALQVLEALKRRGLAYTFADAVSFRCYDRYLTQLFSHLHREPPKKFSRCTVSQLVQADKMVFQKMIENGIKPKRNDTGACPMDKALIEALESYQVSFTLIPLPAREKPKPKPQPVYKPQFDKDGKGKSKGKGKGKGKNKSGSKFYKIPAAIADKGGVAETPDGESICYSYNLGGCSQAKPGESCMKGKHVCCKCFQDHSMQNHGP